MATNTLSVRTLGLATVALVLACGHAVHGDGSYRVRPRPGVSRGTTVASLGGSRSAGVATFSGQPGAKRGVIRSAASKSAPSIRTQAGLASSSRAPSSTSQAARPKAAPGTQVRRVVVSSTGPKPRPATQDWAQAARASARGQPAVLAALQTSVPPPALSRNAFSVGGVERGAQILSRTAAATPP